MKSGDKTFSQLGAFYTNTVIYVEACHTPQRCIMDLIILWTALCYGASQQCDHGQFPDLQNGDYNDLLCRVLRTVEIAEYCLGHVGTLSQLYLSSYSTS